MSKDLKDLIDTVEKETKTRSELEATINSLREEIKRLNFTIKEQELLIKEQQEQISGDQIQLPSEIKVLKDLVISQRQELSHKENELERLNERLDEFSIQQEGYEKTDLSSIENEELINAQRLIIQLTEENDQYRNEIEALKSQLEEIQTKERELEDLEVSVTEENEELINLKRLNFQLMEENGLLRIEVESLKAQLQDSKEQHSEELELANEKIELLNSELKDHEAQVNYLKEELEKSSEASKDVGFDVKEFESVKDELLKVQKENQELNKMVLNLKENILKQSDKEKYKLTISYDFPQHFQVSLFKRMYELMDEISKKAVIELLIKDLNNKNNVIKRNAIKILSEIKDKRVYDAFIDMIHDNDWIVRYNLLKALTKFDIEEDKLKGLLKGLSKDADVDVRELAMKVLNELSN